MHLTLPIVNKNRAALNRPERNAPESLPVAIWRSGKGSNRRVEFELCTGFLTGSMSDHRPASSMDNFPPLTPSLVRWDRSTV